MAANKNRFLLEKEEAALFSKKLFKTCVPACFQNIETTVLSNEEAECFTNCMGKGAATASAFKLLNADADLKRYGGLKA